MSFTSLSGARSSASSSDSGSSHFIALDDMVVKHGTMYLKNMRMKGKIRFKAWYKRFLILRDESATENAHMEIYLSENNDNCRIISLDLTHVTGVEEYRESRRFPNAIIVTRTGGSPLVLGSECQNEVNSWRLAVTLLMQKQRKLDRTYSKDDNFRPVVPDRTDPLDLIYTDGDVGYYAVRVMASEAAGRLGLSGDFLMSITTSHVVLSDACNVTRLRWALLDVIKFKCEEDESSPWLQILTMQAGISCGAREGVYKFSSKFGRALIKEVSKAYRQLTVSRDLEMSSKAENVTGKKVNENEIYHSYLKMLPDELNEYTSNSANNMNLQFHSSVARADSCSSNPPEDTTSYTMHTPAPPAVPPRPRHTLPEYIIAN